MKLYHFPPSPNSRRVLAVAYHIGLDPELINVSLPEGEHMAPDFVALNPNHKIPTFIDDDGFVLWESTAIMQYLAQRESGHTLYPGDIKQQAEINKWLYWNVAHWSAACGIYLFENLAKGLFNMGDPDPEELKKGEEYFLRYGEVLNDHLKDRKWMVGDDVTLADYAVASFLDHAEVAQMPVKNFEHIQRWYAEIEALEAWKKSAPSNFM
jgi:glutathione S-transferase